MSTRPHLGTRVQAQLDGFLSERPERTAGHDTLLFLGRTMPGTRLLLEYCLKALHIGEDGADVGGPLALVAAELLGANFRGDPEVLKAILSGRAQQYLYEKTILCLCHDVTDADVRRAVRRGFDHPETVKRFTAAFMGPCQGRSCAELVAVAIARVLGVPVEAVTATTARPPAFPVRMGLLAGGDPVDR